MTPLVVLGSVSAARQWISDHGLSEAKIITPGGMLVGYQFALEDIIVLPSWAAARLEDRMEEWADELALHFNRADCQVANRLIFGPSLAFYLTRSPGESRSGD